jgi:hypothetical protein
MLKCRPADRASGRVVTVALMDPLRHEDRRAVARRARVGPKPRFPNVGMAAQLQVVENRQTQLGDHQEESESGFPWAGSEQGALCQASVPQPGHNPSALDRRKPPIFAGGIPRKAGRTSATGAGHDAADSWEALLRISLHYTEGQKRESTPSENSPAVTSQSHQGGRKEIP